MHGPRRGWTSPLSIYIKQTREASAPQGKEGGILLPSYFNSPRELLAACCLGSLLRQDEESAARPAAGLR